MTEQELAHEFRIYQEVHKNDSSLSCLIQVIKCRHLNKKLIEGALRQLVDKDDYTGTTREELIYLNALTNLKP